MVQRIEKVQKTKAVAYPSRWFQNRRLLLGAVAVIGLSLLLTNQLKLPGPLSLVLAAQIVLFLLLFHRPVWAMAALIVGQLTSSGYMFAFATGTQISIRFLWTVLAVSLLVPILKQKGGIELGIRGRRILIPAIIFFALATIANAVNTDLSYTLKYLRLIATALVILIFLPAVVKNERDLKLLALVALVTASISSIVAVMQHYGFKGLPVYTLYGGATWAGRTSGLAESPVHLGYDLPIILMPMVALYFLRGVKPRMRKILLLLTLIMLAALYFTYTRSGMVALAPSLLLIILLMKGKAKKELFLIALILGAASLYYAESQGNRYSKGFGEDQSATGRLVLWQTGAEIAMNYPLLGIGADRFQEISVEYKSGIDRSLQGVAGVLGTQAPHNDFIRVWLSFGTPALIAFLMLFAGIFRNFLDAYRRSSRRFVKGFALGCCAALATYVVSAATHNVMDSVFFLWILAGLSVALLRLAEAQKARAAGKRP